MAVDTATVIGLAALSYLSLQKVNYLNKGAYGAIGKFIGFNMSIFLDWTLLLFMGTLVSGLDAGVVSALTGAYMYVFFIPNILLTVLYLSLEPLVVGFGLSLDSANKIRGVFGEKPREA